MVEVGKTYSRPGFHDKTILHIAQGHVMYTDSQGNVNCTDIPWFERNYKEVKPKVKVGCWVTCYKDKLIGGGYKTREAAYANRVHECIAIKYVEFDVEEGEGLKLNMVS